MRNTLLLLSIFIFKMGWAYTAFEDPLKNPTTITTSKDIAGNLMSPEFKGISPLSVANLDYCIPSAQNCNEGDRFQTLKIKQGSSSVYSMNNTVCNNGYTFNDSETISLELSKTYTLDWEVCLQVPRMG